MNKIQILKHQLQNKNFIKLIISLKEKGGKRRIDDPCGDLKTIQKSIADFFRKT